MAVQVVPVAQMMVEMAEMVRKVLVDLFQLIRITRRWQVVLVWVAVEWWVYNSNNGMAFAGSAGKVIIYW